ncbi:MAG: nitrilase family protein [Clostridium sp.]|nr:nitrilase family protein [Clostridium sp.]
MDQEISYAETKRIRGKESEVKVASIQMEPVFGNKQLNLKKTLDLINEAADQGAQIIVLPELCNTGYMFNSRAEAFSLAEEVPAGASSEAWIEAARKRKVYIAAGITEREGNDLYNSSVFVGPEGYIGKHRKVCLWDEEKLFFEPGNLGNQVFHTPLGRISLLICYDMWYPEQWRNCALGGADIVLVSTAWIYYPDLPYGVGNLGVFLGIGAALCNNFFVAVADRVGTERGCKFPGNSLIIDQGGKPLAGPVGMEEETIVYAELNLSDARRNQWTEFANPIRDRRIDLWGSYIGDPSYDKVLPR